MVKNLIALLVATCLFGLGALVGFYNNLTGLHLHNFVLPKDKWECNIIHVASGDCVVYTINEAELEKYRNSGHREHNDKQGPPVHKEQPSVPNWSTKQ